jgi:membrane associated rhomboid family serine protease
MLGCMTLDPSVLRPQREPMVNAPAVVLLLIAVLFAIHLLRLFLSDGANLRLVLDLGFVPARLTVALAPDRMDEILSRLSDGSHGLDADQQLALARYVLGRGDAKAWTLVTHAFLHGSWAHVIFNSLWLLAFGTPVARRLGALRFLVLFFACAVAGAAAHALTHADDIVPMIGASGGISGLMAAATRFAFRRHRPLAIMDGEAADRGPALSLAEVARDSRVLIFLAVWFGVNLLFGFASAPLGLSEAGIAWEAHVGGFLAGFLLFPLFDPISRRPI